MSTQPRRLPMRPECESALVEEDHAPPVYHRLPGMNAGGSRVERKRDTVVEAEFTYSVADWEPSIAQPDVQAWDLKSYRYASELIFD